MSAGDVTSSATTSNASWPTTEKEQSGDTYFELIWYGVIVPILYGMVTILGVTGNILVIYVIMTRERMRTVTNLLLLNLAIADLCFVVVIPPPTAYVMAANRWPFGDIPCRLMHYLVNVTAYVTVYTLVLIALIRYMTIVHTTRTARFRTSRHVVGAIAGVWILMLALNVPVLVSYSGGLPSATPNPASVVAADSINQVTSIASVEAEAPVEGVADAVMTATVTAGDQTTTAEEASAACLVANPETGQRLFVTFFAFAYVLPLCVIAGFSIGIVRHITRHKAPNTASSVSSSGSRAPSSARSGGGGGGGSTCGAAAVIGSAVSSVSSSSGGRRKGSHSANRKRQAGLMLVLVVVMFAALWLPVHIHLLLQQFRLLPNDAVYEVRSTPLFRVETLT
jgi:hypothetical protein